MGKSLIKKRAAHLQGVVTLIDNIIWIVPCGETVEHSDSPDFFFFFKIICVLCGNMFLQCIDNVPVPVKVSWFQGFSYVFHDLLHVEHHDKITLGVGVRQGCGTVFKMADAWKNMAVYDTVIKLKKKGCCQSFFQRSVNKVLDSSWNPCIIIHSCIQTLFGAHAEHRHNCL